MSDQDLVVGLEKAMKAVLEAVALRGGADEMVIAPTCRLDLETYRLMARQARWGKYGEYLSRAVQQVKPWMDSEKIRLTATLVKAGRVGGNSQIVRVRIRPEELKWVEEVAQSCGVKPRVVLESVLYLYTRAVA